MTTSMDANGPATSSSSPGHVAAAPGFVDVGIPAHGRPAYLQEAIESVLDQTLSNWRLTICEDGAGDGEVARTAARYLGDPRVRFRSTGRAVGAAQTTNTLLRSGGGQFVATLHDDDAWDPTFLERRLEFLERNPVCGAVFSPNLEMDGTGRITAKVPPRFSEGVHESLRFVPSLLLRNPIIPASVVIRRAALEAVGGALDVRFERIYDYELWVRLALNFPIGYLHAYDVRYRIHARQSRRVTGRASEELRLLDHFEQLVGDRVELQLTARQRARKRSGFTLSAALDEVALGRRRAALSLLRDALVVHKPSVVDVRAIGTLLGLGIGPRAFSGLRGSLRRRDAVLHRRPR
jgi:glycosyltransferase involved in cell wall biosynthesis